ncbi:MAG: Holliday junction resolvase RuvX [Clostridia bacterium]|nr:Holliday junction resolvase RuvX [Clostridia bacterium]MBP3554876.1 Holliday junction resolvase RuvX [Clostridia bacterium]MBQ8419139.1 Holliday junction resolvase RuvX [Clostridia bacterium]
MVAKKILGVDYGEARTGLAYSDALGLYAVGMGNVKGYNLEKAAEEIVKKAKEIGAELIVIGKPFNMNFTAGEKVEKVTELARIIGTLCDIPIDFYDERLTTVSAHQILQTSGVRAKNRKGVVDSLAAELILQGYMDRQKNITK